MLWVVYFVTGQGGSVVGRAISDTFPGKQHELEEEEQRGQLGKTPPRHFPQVAAFTSMTW